MGGKSRQWPFTHFILYYGILTWTYHSEIHIQYSKVLLHSLIGILCPPPVNLLQNKPPSSPRAAWKRAKSKSVDTITGSFIQWSQLQCNFYFVTQIKLGLFDSQNDLTAAWRSLYNQFSMPTQLHYAGKKFILKDIADFMLVIILPARADSLLKIKHYTFVTCYLHMILSVRSLDSLNGIIHTLSH